MNRKLLILIVLIVIIAAGAFGYKEYKKSQDAAAQIASVQSTQTNTNSSVVTNAKNNQVDKNASPKEQQMEGQLNSLDNGNHN